MAQQIGARKDMRRRERCLLFDLYKLAEGGGVVAVVPLLLKGKN